MKAVKIELTDNEIRFLKEFKKKGMRNAREIMRANVLLQVNKGLKIKNIAEDLEIHRDTVRKIKKRYLEGGLERA
ncbi:MAG: helix-turn-helix domain-containing protein, partial [Methanobrevibacter sp.]|nr:helix-turn-helix domain-containing protein [Candidatus Methanovirga australis]